MENIDPKKFGIKIKEIRNQKGYSLRQVSNQSKIDDMPVISPSYWSLVERGERNIPKISTLKRMAKGLRVDESTILNLAGLSETIDNNVPSWATEKDINDLHDFLATNGQMTYKGMDLSKEQRERVDQIITQVFWEELEKERKKNER
ncbi:helix-turn-helix transcriptional regulator [Lentilactobacillus senioris]|uniref:helix-turn-helix domain-containing protein n=1 Tax=Lentilactobacillus senioris TaxID=931534 RepID=UPI00227DA739|nr:helix-turn-helix transcriptional regulator [Lentilactobacillus senioris]MCY9807080.1 helix-turn-helix transcriptional regulator [Lentilactobacillus senioris]